MMRALCLRALSTAAAIVVIVGLFGLAYGFAVERVFVYTYAVTANLAVGAVILLSGLITLATPTALLVKKGRLVDSTTFGEKYAQAGERKHQKAYEMIYVGVIGIGLTAIIQLLLYL